MRASANRSYTKDGKQQLSSSTATPPIYKNFQTETGDDT
ncbi:hypothetical protein LMG28727_03468 [Paraburkholderia kirstenboschensis]|nr:hypothetical protein LMG28727_03468 [Paraburkholderia kirstenboschensis]